MLDFLFLTISGISLTKFLACGSIDYMHDTSRYTRASRMIDLGCTRSDSLRSSVGTAGLTLPMKRMVPSFLVVLTLLSLVQTAPAEGPQHRKLSAVPFTEVKIQD
ncbi:MAG: hypothetical protein OSA84_12590, partial [Akkermansiaceae bacterium]|nr:hypothetical protein [Akkermansiaceae bacterium]